MPQAQKRLAENRPGDGIIFYGEDFHRLTTELNAFNWSHSPQKSHAEKSPCTQLNSLRNASAVSTGA